jgi:trimeric autotransporter adhesin
MVAIFTGLGAGFVRGSANILGGAGQLGNSAQGRGGESVSVNAATGNLLVSQQDEFLIGRGLDIGVSRTYNSLGDASDGDNGDQWQQSSYRRIFAYVAGSSVKRQYADGSVITYAWNAARNAFLTTDGDGAHDTLSYAGGVWTWVDGSSQVSETYAAYGTDNWRITQAQDRANNATNLVTYSYIGDKLDKITSADGSWIQYTWSGNNITQVLARYTNLATSGVVNQTRTRYAYDGYNRLTQVTVDLTPSDNAIADGKTYVTNYTYHGTTKQVATISQADGSSLSISYDASSRVSSMTQTVAAGDSRTTAFSYLADYTNITGPDGQVTRMDYDGLKQLKKITAPPASAGATAQNIQFTYDTNGNLIAVTDGAGKITNYSYVEANYFGNSGKNDANGNVTHITDPNSNSVTRTYDVNNNKLTETSTGSISNGASALLTTRYAYDGYNQLRFVVSPEGLVTEYYYDGYGQMYWQVEYPQATYNVSGLAASASISEAALNAWRTSFNNKYSKIVYSYFDARGNVTQVNRYGRAGSSWGNGDTSEGWSISQFSYDHAGRLLSRNNYGELAETFVYDGLNRLIGSTDLAGGTTNIVFNDAATQTVVTLANGQVTTSTYNKAGDLVSMTEGSDWSPSGTSSFKYDKNGVLRMATDGDGGNSYFLYDKAGRKTADINHYGWLTEYRYDAANRVTATVRYLTALSASQLSGLSNPNNTLEIATIRPAANSTYDKWSWAVYDSGGRVSQTIDGVGGVTAFAYDNSNRLIKTTSYVNTLAQATIDGFKTAAPLAAVAVTADSTKDRVTRSFYNRDGQMVGALNAEGYLTENIYDKAGQLIEEIGYAQLTNSGYWTSGTFDQLKGSISTAFATNRRVRHVYDGQGLKRYSVNAQGLATRYDYNVAGRLTQSVSFAAAISATDFTYDNVKVLVNAVANGTNDRSNYISYNTRGQVATTTDATGLVTSFTYDLMGNVTKTVVGTDAAARVTRNWYTQKGELRFSVDVEGFVSEQGFDADGQVVQTIRYRSVQNFSDATTIAQVSAAVAADYATANFERFSFSHYANGGLYSQMDALGVLSFTGYYANGAEIDTYLASNITSDTTLHLQRFDSAGKLQYKYEGYGEAEATVTEYRYDGLGNLTSIVDPRGVITSYTYDRLGRVTSVTDAAGGQTLYQYDAFGNQTAVRDARGYWTYNSYDNLGRLTQTTDASGVATTSSFTNFGELASVTRAGATTSFQYDKLGRVTRSTDALNFYETYAYDIYGNRISKTAKSATGSVTTGGTTTYSYDRRGLLLTETLPMGSYNNAGTLVSSTVTNKFEYDAYGNRTKMIEAFGLAEARTTEYKYDKNNRLIETIGQTFLGQTPREYITYDARGNVTSTTNAAGGRTVFYYDDLNRKTVEISAAGTYTKYTYDKNGNVTDIRVYEASLSSIPADGGSEEEAVTAPLGSSRYTTFVYDSLNRMTSSSVHGAKSGYWNGSSWLASTGPITTQYQYDANGNVEKMTDGYLNATYSYYDALGRKTAQVDQENYITTWTYNADGNVLREHRYDYKVATPTSTSVAPTPTPNATNDRVTDFTYDLNGNRLSEMRHSVLVHNGVGAQTSATATINYSYNGLGQVMRKTEATGDFVDYSYDAAGRLTIETRKAFTDFAGGSVTPTVDYFYDGVNNLSRTRQRGSGDSAERVTLYNYSGGKLTSLADAEGNYRYYWYDQGGRQTHEYFTRTKSDGSADTSYNGNLTSYDVAGRAIYRWQADYTGGTWTTKGPVTSLTYNAFGDVTDTVVGGVLQQQNRYDLAGRLTGTTSGDGIWKYFGYDQNANQTVAITSAGGNLGGSFDAALASVGAENVNATYTVYDKRNLATTVFEEGRRFSASGALQNLTTQRTYTAFGEVLSETNAAGAVVSYRYNNMGRMIRSESPAVEIVGENGVAQTVRPAEDYYYDASGRLVATRDANGTYSGQIKNANTGNLTILTLLTGTGYGGSQSQVTAETHSDGGIKQMKYDIHGDMRAMIDEIGRQSTRAYDRMGRVIILANGAGLVDRFAYDILGQQIRHWNNQLNPYDTTTGLTGESERTDYDIQGRVISQRSFGGDTTTTSYVWDSTIGASGILGFGGWLQTTTMANGLQSQEKTDFFGRITWKRDLSGYRTTDYAYDAAGRMTTTSTNGMQVTFGWFNSGMQASVISGTPGAGQVNTTWTRDVTTYSYNVTGSRLTEYMVRESGQFTPGHWDYTESGNYPPYYNNYPEEGYNEPVWVDDSYYSYSQVIKNQSATYDALGRMKTWAEVGTANAPASSTTTSYDASGNVRRTLANYYALDASGNASTATTRDYWFRYDSMNRVVTNQGILENGQIVRGMNSLYGASGSQDILYNAAGERTAVATLETSYDGYGGYTVWEQRENYFYDTAGRLSSTYRATGSAVYGGYGTAPVIPAASGTGTLRSVFGYDLMGRATSQTDYDTNGYTSVFSRSAAYNAKGQLTSDYSTTKKTDNKTYSVSNSYNYTDYNSGQYMLGSVAWMQSTSSVSGTSGSTTSRTVNGYAWWDGAVQSSIQNKPNINQSTTYNTSFALNNFGQLTSAYIADGKPRSISYTLDELGQIIRRDEGGYISGQTGNPHEVWYRFGGRQLGYTGNNGTSEVSYDASVGERRTVSPSTQGTFRSGQVYGTGYADFAQNYDPINSFYQGAAGGSYRVNQGDTLQGIAQSLYGDSSLWYKIAEANGLSASGALIEGQTLVLPTGLTKSKNNAGTFKPYNASEAIGDLSPTTPQPPKKPKCGVFGQILLAVIAVAVTLLLTPASGATFGQLVLGAVAGNVASQAVGVMTGIQDKFSFKGVALAALSAGVGAGVGSVIKGAVAGSQFVGDVIRGAVGSAVTQGVAVATGLQDKFSWAGVAAAGIGAGVGGAVLRGMSKGQGEFANGKTDYSDGNGGTYKPSEGSWVQTGDYGFAAQSASSAASAIAGAATRSAMEGSSFGRNLVAALPDVIGQIAGGALGRTINSAIAKAQAAAEKAKISPVVRTEADNTLLEKVANANSRIVFAQSDDSASVEPEIIATKAPNPNDDPLEEIGDATPSEREFVAKILGWENDERGINSSMGPRRGRAVEKEGKLFIEWDTVTLPNGNRRHLRLAEIGESGTPVGVAPEGDPYSIDVNREKLDRRGIYNTIDDNSLSIYFDANGQIASTESYSANPNLYHPVVQDYGSLKLSFEYLSQDPNARGNIETFLSTDMPIVMNGSDNFVLSFNAQHSYVTWNPTMALQISEGVYQSPALGLYHEVGHALRWMTSRSATFDDLRMSIRSPETNRWTPVAEDVILRQYEIPTARFLGEPVRFDHAGKSKTVQSPTESSRIRN